MTYLFKNLEGYNVIYKKYDDKSFNLNIGDPSGVNVKNIYFNTAHNDYYKNLSTDSKVDYYSEKGSYLFGIESIIRSGNCRYLHVRTKDDGGSEVSQVNSTSYGNTLFASLTNFIDNESKDTVST